jgi:DNA-binding NtrC family response regulator
MTHTILLIEDNDTQAEYYRQILETSGYSVARACSAAEALDLFSRTRPAAVTLDLMLPDRDGLELMQDCHALAPDVPFVVITAQSTIQTAVEAMRHGASEFLPKPVSEAHLLRALGTALTGDRHPKLQVVSGTHGPAMASAPQSDPMRAAPLPGFVGYAPVMHELYRQVRAVSRSRVPIFLRGPNGSGRLACAKAIHTLAHDTPEAAPFTTLMASVMSPEQQLNALTGVGNRPDVITAAFGGTAYISEPCTLSDPAQAALMERLQRLDAEPQAGPGVQLVTATTRDPFTEVRDGHLREDLFHRLYVAPVRVPALAERGEDVVAIANATIRALETRRTGAFVGLDPDVAEFFRTYVWPGNVRQLVNVIKSTLLLHEGPLITMDMLPMELTTDQEANETTTPFDSLVGRSLSEVEEIIIEETIRQQKGSVPRAARVLDVSPSTLYRKREAWAKRGARADGDEDASEQATVSRRF